MDNRTPDQKYGTHLCRRLLETYDGCDAGVRGYPITIQEADAYVEKLVADNAALLEALERMLMACKRIIEQRGLDSDIWYAMTRAQEQARTTIAQATGESS